MSRMRSRISMSTGQISSHALQLVHAKTSSGWMRSNSVPAPSIVAVEETGGDRPAYEDATSPDLRTISLGSSGLPVMFAGQTEVQRPQMVQASVSKICFQVRSAATLAPMVSMSSTSIRFGISRIAPLGRSRAERKRFAGEVNMCRSLVTGRITRNATKATTWVTQRNWCQPAAEDCSKRFERG